MDSVREYYDRNTARFVRYGHGASGKAIHRAVWTPGITTREEAILTVNRIVAAAAPADPELVLDLGCGVGGTIGYLLQHDPEGATPRYLGITLSETQGTLATELFAHEDRVRFQVADLASPEAYPDPGSAPIHAYMVESLLHIPDTTALFKFLAACALGSRLTVVDDFLAQPETTLGRRDRSLLARFRAGWHAHGLDAADALDASAASAGLELVRAEDLSDFLELGRPRDHLIRILMKLRAVLPVQRPFWANMDGGDALQALLTRRVLRYFARTYERR